MHVHVPYYQLQYLSNILSMSAVYSLDGISIKYVSCHPRARRRLIYSGLLAGQIQSDVRLGVNFVCFWHP